MNERWIGALITDDAECTRDIGARLGNGTGNLKSMQRLWQRHINRHKNSVIKNNCMVGCYVWMRRLDVKEI